MATNDIKFNIKQGELSNLPSTKEDGTLYVATKENSKAELYVDLNGTRYLISDALTADTALSTTSENAVQNKVVNSELTNLQAQLNAQGTVVYGTCSTAAATAAKVVTVSGSSTWTLRAGSIIVVMFSATNTAENPTLNVNNTGAKPVYYTNAQLTTKNLTYAGYKNRPMVYVYNGTGYHFISWGYESGNTNTQIRVYRQDEETYNGDYPLIASRTKAASLGTVGEESSYEGVYGLISDTDENIPTINPTTGLVKIKNLSVTNKIDGSIEEADHATSADTANSASLAAKLSVNDTGSTTQPIYFKDGVPVVANAYSTLLTAASSDTTNNLSVTVGGTTKNIAELTATKLETKQADTTKAYILGSSGTGTQPVYDDEIYLDTSAGQMVAKTFKGTLDGLATQAETLTGLTASITELNYTDGVTSNIQTQLNSKASTAVATTSAKGLMSAADKAKLDGIDLTAIDNAAQGYANTAKEEAIASAKSTAEQMDTVTLNAAKEHTNTQINNALKTAAEDATSKANKALADAKTYTNTAKDNLIDGANNKTLGALEDYIDSQVSGVNSSFSNYYTKTEIDNKNFATTTYADKAEADAVATSQQNINSAVAGLVNNASNGYATLGEIETKIKEVASTANSSTANFANYYTKTESDAKYDSKGSASAAQTAAINAAKTETTNQVSAAKTALLGDAGTNYNTLGKLEDQIQATDKKATDAAAKFANYTTTTDLANTYATKTLVSETADATLLSANDYTDDAIADLIGGASEDYDTLLELEKLLKGNDTIISEINTALASKANASDLTSHTSNTTVHITATERTKWNGYDSSKAPNNHASTATTYGVGTDTKYGHLKISDGTTIGTDEVVTGVAASKTAAASLQSQINETNAALSGYVKSKEFSDHVLDFEAHVGNATHITSAERTAWNAIKSDLVNGASSGYNTLKGLEDKVKEAQSTANEATTGLETKADKKAGVYYVEGTGTTDGTWVGSNPAITEYYEGLTVAFYINDAGTSGGDTLNINGLGAVQVYRNTSKLTTHLSAKTVVLFVYSEATGTPTWHWADYDSTTYEAAYCATAAATAKKTASCSNYTATANTYTHVLIRYANTSKTAITLNINSKGAKPIYINGAASSTTNYILPAGTYLAYYDGTNYHFRTDGYLPGPGSAEQNALITTNITNIAKKLDKTTYEYNKELALGSSGKVCIGKFPMYDSNITVNINSTTNQTYHATLVIATQNINTTKGGTYVATVYGDEDNKLTSLIQIHYSSGSNIFSVYINLPSWSKNLLHIQAVSLAGTPTNIAELVSEIPTVDDADLVSIVNADRTAISNLIATHAAVKATGSALGHVTLSNSTSSDSDANDGVAATPKAVKAVSDTLTDHATTGATSSTLAHVKLSDATTNTTLTSTSGNTAATPRAVSDALTAAKNDATTKANAAEANAKTHANNIKTELIGGTPHASFADLEEYLEGLINNTNTGLTNKFADYLPLTGGALKGNVTNTGSISAQGGFVGALTGNATTATTATKLSSVDIGDTNTPVYFDANGKPVEASGIVTKVSNLETAVSQNAAKFAEYYTKTESNANYDSKGSASAAQAAAISAAKSETTSQVSAAKTALVDGASTGYATLGDAEEKIKAAASAASTANANFANYTTTTDLANTYATKTLVTNTANSTLSSAQTYTNNKIADLIGGAGEDYDTLKELADLLTNNNTAVGEINAVLKTKANASDLTAHTGDTTIHITADERTAWNAAESNAKTHANTLNTNLINGASSGYNTLKGLETEIKKVASTASSNTANFANYYTKTEADALHKGAFTALTSTDTAPLSITIGGTSRSLATLYATNLVSSEKNTTAGYLLLTNAANGTGYYNKDIKVTSSGDLSIKTLTTSGDVEIKGAASVVGDIETTSGVIKIGDGVTLQYNSTDKALEFVFA